MRGEVSKIEGSMKMPTVASVAMLLLLSVAVSNATSITYNVSRSIGAGSVTGTIQTDGTLGILSTVRITDWVLHLSDGSFTSDLFGPLSGNNSAVQITGSSVTATANQLLFDFDASGSSRLLFQRVLGSGANFYCLTTVTNSGCGSISEFVQPTAVIGARISQVGTQAIGTVPEPSGFALILGGLGLITILANRKRG